LGFGGVKGTYEQTAASSADTGRGGQDTTSRSTIVAFRDENRGLNNAYRLQIRGDAYPNTFPFGTVADNTVRIDQNMASFELAVAHGPFKFQSEFANSKFDAKSNPYDLTQRNGLLPLGNAAVTATAKASYISFIWNITGEDFAKSYSKGAWTNIKPKEDFMKDYGGVVGNGMGAWQLAYRISQYSVTTSNDVGARDATSATDPTRQRVNDGIGATGASNSRLQNSPTATTQTVGLNWIMSQNARVMFNYSDTKFGNTVEYLDTASNNKTTTSEQIFSVRTQINF
jgi:phosphate-selective porin